MNQPHSPNDLLPIVLEEAVERIRSLSASEDAISRLITSATAEESDRSLAPGNSKRAISRRNWLRWAVVASVASAVLLGAALWTASPNNLFASMRQAMAEVKTIKFVSRLTIAKQTVTETNGFVSEEGAIRTESSEHVAIQDLVKGKGLELDLKNKKATVVPLVQQDPSRELIQAVFAVLRGEGFGLANEVGVHEIDGVELVEYEIEIKDVMVRIFIEAESALPLKIMMPIVVPFGNSGAHIEISDFVFDQRLDESLFAFDIPQDFEVTVVEPIGPVDDTMLTLDSAVGIGPVKFGFTTEQVIEQFGQPHLLLRDVDNGISIGDVLFYKSRGIQFHVDPTHGVVTISAANSSWFEGTEKFAGQFAGGIRIGDDITKVLEVLGQPSRKERGNYIYDSPEKPRPFSSTSFRSKEGKVNSMGVMQFP